MLDVVLAESENEMKVYKTVVYTNNIGCSESCYLPALLYSLNCELFSELFKSLMVRS